MATLVCFHAHPDDESIATAGVMARAADAGHRVVLVVATRGEHGEVAEGVLDPGEELWQRRVKETHLSAEILGVRRVEFLGYVDSGMAGEPLNDEPGAFCRADRDEAAERLATILREERADVLTVYDSNGGYGHPDHVQVHHVGVRAAELAGTPHVFESTFNRDHLVALMVSSDLPDGIDAPDIEGMNLGVPESDITTAVDVSSWIARKRAAMVAHGSQIVETSFFLTLPEDAFLASFGVEWFIHRGATPGKPWETDLLADVEAVGT